MITLLWTAMGQTLLMVFVSTLAGVIGGIPLSLLLWMTQKKGLRENQKIYTLVGFLVNIFRSIPYIILVIGLIPVTRWVVGSAIGTGAACVPLSLAAIMLIARGSEEAFRSVSFGLIEAAQSMGATHSQIIKKVLLPEALPGLVSTITLVMINLIGFSAMAGAVGGGGLGDLAIRYGYQRYDVVLILEVIIILVLCVQGIQEAGERLIQKSRNK